VLLNLLELACLALIVVGVGMWSVPAALILAGVLGVLVLERGPRPAALVRGVERGER
jgi:hypothetical protein